MARRGDWKNFTQLADASHLRDARLDKIHRTGTHEAVELEQRRHVHSGGNRDAAGPARFSQPSIIFRWPDRLFQPLQMECLEFLSDRLRFVQCPCTIDVER